MGMSKGWNGEMCFFPIICRWPKDNYIYIYIGVLDLQFFLMRILLHSIPKFH